ncbi:MAG: hypothetical protein L0Y73_01025, partial [Candidatus Aminicenantes bacterium]|nr:hypothetical protein [Candidatus Aminicenantes bacterium]
DHFWKSGVELTLDGAYALVLSEPLERKLSVSVCGGNKIELLTIARHHLQYIHRSLNMEKDKDYKEMIPCYCTPCRTGDTPHLFQHEKLRRFTEKGITHAQCQESGEQVSIDRLLRGFAPPPPKKDLKELFDMLILTITQLQGRAKSIGNREDDRTSYIVDLLTARGYIVKDQTRRGSTFSGKGPGELDMLIETPDGAAVSIVEALNLDCLNRSEIAEHFQKLFLYDAPGLENNYLLVYAESDDFTGLWRKYLDYLPEIELKYKLSAGPVEEPSHYADIKIARTKHNRHNKETSVYHIFINMKI